jgi:hypothetical protein
MRGEGWCRVVWNLEGGVSKAPGTFCSFLSRRSFRICLSLASLSLCFCSERGKWFGVRGSPERKPTIIFDRWLMKAFDVCRLAYSVVVFS